MSEVKISSDEAQVLRTVLNTLLVRDRTGELGLLHGMDRFVSTQRTLTKTERVALDAAAKKLGLAGMRIHKS